jgi:hypothetical protein
MEIKRRARVDSQDKYSTKARRPRLSQLLRDIVLIFRMIAQDILFQQHEHAIPYLETTQKRERIFLLR